jgi:hypothetical protein
MAVTLFGGLLDIVRISMKHKQFGTDVSLQLMLTACVFISTQTGTAETRAPAPGACTDSGFRERKPVVHREL